MKKYMKYVIGGLALHFGWAPRKDIYEEFERS